MFGSFRDQKSRLRRRDFPSFEFRGSRGARDWIKYVGFKVFANDVGRSVAKSFFWRIGESKDWGKSSVIEIEYCKTRRGRPMNLV